MSGNLADRPVLPALDWTLRIGALLCFVGHGAFGIMTKKAWVPYFGVVGIGPEMAYRLMPLIGMLDITMGCLMLTRPRPAVAVWMFAWAVWTALLRPLSGESAWEAVERAGNYGVPAAIIVMLLPWHGVAQFFRATKSQTLNPWRTPRLRVVLTIAVVFILVGHGALALGGKPGIIANYASVVSPNTAIAVTRVSGVLEVALGMIVATYRWQSVPLLLFIAVWKLATESLFVVAGAPFWEIVERGGSYAAPIALALALLLSDDKIT